MSTDYQYNEDQKLWLGDLKKTKAKQTRGALHKTRSSGNEGWCCLGRACKVAGIPTSYVDGAVGIQYFKGRNKDGKEATFDELLPYDLVEKLKLCDEEGSFRKYDYEEEGGTYSSLTDLNDSGFTFKQIARIIEADPWNVFVE